MSLFRRRLMMMAASAGAGEAPPPPSSDVPAEWQAVFDAIDDGSYTTKYKVGDEVVLDLGAEGLLHMQVAAIDTDELANGSGKAPITWVSKELLITPHRMNPAREGTSGAWKNGTGSVGGWEYCEMRKYLQETIFPMIPEGIRARIKEVKKYSTIYNTAGELEKDVETHDKIWIPSIREVNYTSAKEAETKGAIYSELFPDANSRIKYVAEAGTAAAAIGAGGGARNGILDLKPSARQRDTTCDPPTDCNSREKPSTEFTATGANTISARQTREPSAPDSAPEFYDTRTARDFGGGGTLWESTRAERRRDCRTRTSTVRQSDSRFDAVRSPGDGIPTLWYFFRTAAGDSQFYCVKATGFGGGRNDVEISPDIDRADADEKLDSGGVYGGILIGFAS